MFSDIVNHFIADHSTGEYAKMINILAANTGKLNSMNTPMVLLQI